MEPFYVTVSTVIEGEGRRREGKGKEEKRILQNLADYDLFQLEHHIKPDFCNVAGLEVYNSADISEENECDGWTEWYDEEGCSVNDRF